MGDREYGRVDKPLTGKFARKFIVIRYKGLRDVRDSVHDTYDDAAARLQVIANLKGKG